MQNCMSIHVKRTTKALIHFNKPGSKQTPPQPWTVHWRKKCYQGCKIICWVSIESEFKPNKKQNPRAFFTAQVDNVHIDSEGTIHIS